MSANLRLKKALKALKKTYPEIAEETGIPKRTIDNMVKEGATINSDNLVKLNQAYGITPNQILLGSTKLGAEGEFVEEYSTSYEPILEGEFTMVPFYNIKVSAGHGLIPEDRPPLQMAFRTYFIKNVLHADPKDLFMSKIEGDSMYNSLIEDDTILVNRALRRPEEGMYVIRLEDSYQVKRLQRLTGNQVRISSDNKVYRDFEVSLGDDSFEIIGRVVWIGRKL